MRRAYRVPLGFMAILIVMTIYIVAVVTMTPYVLKDAPFPLEILFFLVGGIAWILPVKPILSWMKKT